MTFDSYQSPFSWRYASPEMRSIWSENNKRLLWRRIWVCLAETQAEYGLVTPEQVADLQTHATALNISRALEIEAEIKHDLMAEVRAFAEQCPVGGGIIHLGATSMDVKDNAEALQVFQASATGIHPPALPSAFPGAKNRTICSRALYRIYPPATRRTNHPGISSG